MDNEAKILEIARSIRADARIDYLPRGAFWVGFADTANDAAQYNVDAARVAAALKAAGFRVTVREPNEHWSRTIIRAR